MCSKVHFCILSLMHLITLVKNITTANYLNTLDVQFFYLYAVRKMY